MRACSRLRLNEKFICLSRATEYLSVSIVFLDPSINLLFVAFSRNGLDLFQISTLNKFQVSDTKH